MDGEIVTTKDGSYVHKWPGNDRISSERDILDIMAYCSFSGGGKVLLEEDDLAAAFFDLSSGLAGDILLKLSTYQVKTAIVFDMENIKSEPFKQLVMESNRGKQINFFASKTEAEQWLLAI